MNTIDLTKTGGMPLDQSTLNFMQDTYNPVLKQLGSILGEYVILKGSQELGGWVSINGEIMPFDAGRVEDCYIRETKQSVVFQDGENKSVYITKKLVFGLGTPPLKWADFQKMNPLIELQNNLYKKTPIGTVQMFAGQNLPSGWSSCEGQSLLKSEYLELWNTLQTQDPHSPGRFLLPDLRSRFIVGQNLEKSDYKTVGQTGGDEKIALKVREMPYHNHTGTTNVSGQHSHQWGRLYWSKENTKGFDTTERGKFIQRNTSENGEHSHTFETSYTGNGHAHENRPPYYVMKYIIYLG